MNTLPKSTIFQDTTLSLLREGYLFLPRRLAEHDPPIWRTRLMLRDVVCIAGPEAAELFYAGDTVTRRGAMPGTTLRLLQDKHSVQQLDGAAHRKRKAMFVRMLVDHPSSVDDLVLRFKDAWTRSLAQWEQQGEVTLSDAVEITLAEAALSWAGLPATRQAVSRDARALSGMVANAGRFGPATGLALLRRNRMEKRLQGEIRALRAGKRTVRDGAPIAEIASHRDINGRKLTASIAAVELLNILRPIVAVGRYITFAGLMLHHKAAWRERFAGGSREGLVQFAEEVRRYAPFFPFIGGILTRDTDIYGYRLRKGQWLLFDLYGTCHDPRWFSEPQEFRPERDLSWQKDKSRFVPQGGGDTQQSHRCPGEKVTVALIAEAVRLMTHDMEFDVPAQNVDVSLATVPTGPASGLVLDNIRKR